MTGYGNFLLYSAQHGMVENCLELLKKVTDVNQTNSWENSPLHLACLRGNACIEAVVEYEPELNITNLRLIANLNLLITCPCRNEDILKKFLDASAHPDFPDADGNSALHLIAEQEHTNKTETIARLLVKYNANVNLQNKYQQTPLHIAIELGREDLVKVLLESGALIDIPDENGKTPMDSALEKKTHSPRIFEYLAKHLLMQSYGGLTVNLRHLEKECDTEECQYFRKRCEEEMLQLKSIHAGESTVTYYDILVSPARKIAKYLCNQNILGTLQDLDMNEYILGPILVKKFQEGLKHYYGINLGISAAQKVFPFLPECCIEELIKYLDIDDCSNFNSACNF